MSICAVEREHFEELFYLIAPHLYDLINIFAALMLLDFIEAPSRKTV